MSTSEGRAALEAWLVQAEDILHRSEEPDTDRLWVEQSVELGDAA